jgi:hypothetical protein
VAPVSALMVAAVLVSASTGRAQAPRALPSPAAPPVYLDLFAPAVHRSAYQAFISPLPLDQLLTSLTDPGFAASPGAWRPERLLALDAFGRAGRYDRSKLARLYGARRVDVARGPRVEGGRIVETWTLVSPYPDPRLERLEPGTLILVLRLP